MIRDYCVYRYTLRETGEVIYIGKTDASLKQRIDAHQKEDNFAPYIGLWDIDYLELQNNTETDIIEKYLINYYKPILNTKDNVTGFTNMSIILPDWKPYAVYEEDRKHATEILIKQALRQAKLDDEFICNVLGSDGKPFTLDFYHNGQIAGMSFSKQDIIQSTKKEEDLLHRPVMKHVYTYEPQNIEYLEKHFEEIEEKCFYPVALLWDFQEEQRQYLDILTEVSQMIEDLKRFASEGFQIEDYDKDEYILECNPDCIPYIEDLFYNICGNDGHYYITVDETKFNKIENIQIKIAKERLKIYFAAGIRDFDNTISLQEDFPMIC